MRKVLGVLLFMAAMALPALSQTGNSAAINFAASGDNTAVSSSAGKRIQVYEIYFTVAAATNITIKDGTGGTALTGPITFSGAGSFTLMYRISPPHFSTSQGNNFVINSSNAVQISGHVIYAYTN